MDGVLHSDNVLQLLGEKSSRELSHQVVVHKPAILKNNQKNIKLDYIEIKPKNLVWLTPKTVFELEE